MKQQPKSSSCAKCGDYCNPRCSEVDFNPDNRVLTISYPSLAAVESVEERFSHLALHLIKQEDKALRNLGIDIKNAIMVKPKDDFSIYMRGDDSDRIICSFLQIIKLEGLLSTEDSIKAREILFSFTRRGER